MKIGLVGAFDRYNYGDLLMPIIVEKNIKNNFKTNKIDIKYYGLKSSDMSYAKGKNTEPLSILYKEFCDIVIFVGGEILSTNYVGMFLNLQNSKLKILFYKVLYRLIPKYTEHICKNKLGCISIRPWIVSKNEIKCKKLIYNTVGGHIVTNDDEFVKIKNALETVDYISVREKESFQSVKKIHNNVYLYPDSVVSLSKLINESEIMSNISSIIKNNVEKMNQYFVFQIKQKLGHNNVNEIANQIELIYKETGLNCILLPIGYAQGHEDDVILKKIFNKVRTRCYFAEFCNIYETMYIIKNSKLYLGTSLHGAITAISYEIPHIAVTKNLKKLNNFLNTWNTTPIINSEISELSNNTKKILEKYNDAIKIVSTAKDKMICLVNENFNNINKIIREEINYE